MSFRPSARPAVTCAVGLSLLLAACGGSTSKSTATQENEEKLVKFAKCMREHGVDIHASTQGAGIQVGIQGGPGSSGPKPDSPAFQAAQKACQGLLPGGGPGPGATTNKVNPKGGSGAGFAIGG